MVNLSLVSLRRPEMRANARVRNVFLGDLDAYLYSPILGPVAAVRRWLWRLWSELPPRRRSLFLISDPPASVRRVFTWCSAQNLAVRDPGPA